MRKFLRLLHNFFFRRSESPSNKPAHSLRPAETQEISRPRETQAEAPQTFGSRKDRQAFELQEIDVFIEKDGQVRIEVRGVKGTHCLTVTKELEQALGGEVVKREMTPEANEPAQRPEHQQRQQGAGE